MGTSSTEHIVEDTLYKKAKEISVDRPMHPAIEYGERVISYAELVDLADRCALSLRRRGVGVGDRVAFLAAPCPEVTTVLLACSKIGAIFAGLGPRLSDDELSHLLEDSASTIIFSIERLDGRDFAKTIEEVLGKDEKHRLVRLSDFGAFLEQDAAQQVIPADDPEAAVALIYTSGSTGKPKGVLISNLAILTSVTNALARIDMEDIRALSMLPIDHVAFLANEVVMALLAGGTAVQLPGFDVERTLEAIEQKRITLWCAIPTMLQRLASSGRMDEFDLSSLEYVWWPGPLSREAFDAIRCRAKRLGVSYGMSEAAGGITFSDRDMSAEALLSGVGKPLPSLEVKLDDPVEMDGRFVGEILIRGRQVISEYRGRPDATADSFTEDGWFRTGDLGAFDQEYLSIVGRKKELIRSGGYNISPYEVESAIEVHGAVAFATIVGVKDEEYGEVVAAAVSFADGRTADVEELRAHLRGRLPGYKVPKLISVWSEMPFLANGKVDRSLVRRQLAEEWKTLAQA